MYMSLYIASYLSDLYLSIYIYHIYNIYYIHKHTYRYNISIYLLNIYKHINLYTPTHIHTHTHIYIYIYEESSRRNVFVKHSLSKRKTNIFLFISLPWLSNELLWSINKLKQGLWIMVHYLTIIYLYSFDVI